MGRQLKKEKTERLVALNEQLQAIADFLKDIKSPKVVSSAGYTLFQAAVGDVIVHGDVIKHIKDDSQNPLTKNQASFPNNHPEDQNQVLLNENYDKYEEALKRMPEALSQFVKYAEGKPELKELQKIAMALLRVLMQPKNGPADLLDTHPYTEVEPLGFFQKVGVALVGREPLENFGFVAPDDFLNNINR